MTTETGPADTNRLPESEMMGPPKATKKPAVRKVSKGAPNNGRKPGRHKKAGASKMKTLFKSSPQTARTDFGLSLATFARLTGVPQNTLAKWESDKTVRLDNPALSRICRVVGILEGLARVMQRTFIPTWIGQPNDACKEV